jgi:hypothetical protein
MLVFLIVTIYLNVCCGGISEQLLAIVAFSFEGHH